MIEKVRDQITSLSFKKTFRYVCSPMYYIYFKYTSDQLLDKTNSLVSRKTCSKMENITKPLDLVTASGNSVSNNLYKANDYENNVPHLRDNGENLVSCMKDGTRTLSYAKSNGYEIPVQLLKK